MHTFSRSNVTDQEEGLLLMRLESCKESALFIVELEVLSQYIPFPDPLKRSEKLLLVSMPSAHAILVVASLPNLI